jgi:hypothetical protein
MIVMVVMAAVRVAFVALAFVFDLVPHLHDVVRAGELWQR